MHKVVTGHVQKNVQNVSLLVKGGPYHMHNDGYYQQSRKKNVGKDVEKSEYLCRADGHVKWCSFYGTQYGDSSKNVT